MGPFNTLRLGDTYVSVKWVIVGSGDVDLIKHNLATVETKLNKLSMIKRH